MLQLSSGGGGDELTQIWSNTYRYGYGDSTNINIEKNARFISFSSSNSTSTVFNVYIDFDGKTYTTASNNSTEILIYIPKNSTSKTFKLWNNSPKGNASTVTVKQYTLDQWCNKTRNRTAFIRIVANKQTKLRAKLRYNGQSAYQSVGNLLLVGDGKIETEIV